MDDRTFSKNRDHLLKKKVAKRFFQEALKQARERNLLSDEHVTVDGTLIKAWASLKNFQRKEQEKQENGDEEKGSWQCECELSRGETEQSNA